MSASQSSVHQKIDSIQIFLIAVIIGALIYEIVTLIPAIGQPTIPGGKIINIEPAVGFWLTLLGLLLTIANIIWYLRVSLPYLSKRASLPPTVPHPPQPQPQLPGQTVQPQSPAVSGWTPIQLPPSVAQQPPSVTSPSPTPTSTPPTSQPPVSPGGTPKVGVPQIPSTPSAGSSSPVAGWIPISTTPPAQTPPATLPQASTGFTPSGSTASVNMPDVPKYFRTNRASAGAPFVFEWLPVRDAEGYVIEEADDTNFTQPREVYRGTDTRWTTSQTLIRFYRLCAFNSKGTSAWTDVVSTWL